MIFAFEFHAVRNLKQSPYAQLTTPKMALLWLGLTILLANRDPGQFIYFSF
jgi:hypothetical protein